MSSLARMPSSNILTMARMAGCTVATAESLTVGMVAASLGSIPGISEVYKGGVIAYDNSVKAQLLGVDPGLLDAKGSVDPQVALDMAQGVAKICNTTIGVSTTGVAGPESHDGKTVGTVFVGAWVVGARSVLKGSSQHNFSKVCNFNYIGGRQEIRDQATGAAISVLQEVLDIILNNS